jgi:putative aldouronate transport system permease protein
MINRRSFSKSQIIINIIFVLYALACLCPILIIIAGSFSKESDILAFGYSIIPKTFSLNAYRFILGNGKEVANSYFYTILSTVVGTGVGLIVSAALAYPLARKDFKYRNGFSFYVYFTMLFNGGMVPLYLVYTRLIPVRDTALALIIPNMIGAFYVLLMRTFFVQNIPEAIVESAEIDGASTYRIFFTMILPLAKPVLATVALFSGVAYWNDFFRNMLLANNGTVNNLQYLLYRITQQIAVMDQNPEVARQLGGSIPDETARMAMIIILMGPIVFLYPSVQKYFIKGLTVGSVKG